MSTDTSAGRNDLFPRMLTGHPDTPLSLPPCPPLPRTVSLNARASLAAHLHPLSGHSYTPHAPTSANSHSLSANSPAPAYSSPPTTALGFSAADCRGIGAHPARPPRAAGGHVHVDVQTLVTSGETCVDSEVGRGGKTGKGVEGLAFEGENLEGGRHPYAMK